MPGVPLLSIIVPAYNEARRIPRTLEILRQYLDGKGWRAEVIVVNDGSSDDTLAVVEKFRGQWDALRLLDNGDNRGKGFSVRSGALDAQGEVILFTDADLSAPITEMPKLVDPILKGDCDVTFGSRAVDRSLIGVHQSPFRETSGRIFNLFVQGLTGLPFKDTQCGFKAFRRQRAVPVFQRQRIMGFGFDPEILYIAKKRGLRLREIPVRWDHVEGTTVRFLKDSCQMFLDLLLIRWNDVCGKYR
ncbi:MAG: glycosyltransferase family 2 protein [Acidobacteria bacterium]|nr:glycosyltransferase family 2 protein [Acidobacteriota bacterium]MCI0724085.1 glycosyltransferase family 2 protein [Acidobacteriota bacterium]